MEYFAIKLIHILSSTLLFGTGLGAAFFMWRTYKTKDLAAIVVVSKYVVIADWLFTLPAVLIQPTTGLWLVQRSSLNYFDPWIVLSLILYGIAGLCWMPVVGLQIKMRNLAQYSADTGENLPTSFHRLFRAWFFLGWPAFLSVLSIFYLMVFKPTLW